MIKQRTFLLSFVVVCAVTVFCNTAPASAIPSSANPKTPVGPSDEAMKNALEPWKLSDTTAAQQAAKVASAPAPHSFYGEQAGKDRAAREVQPLPGGFVRMTGQYRLAAGLEDEKGFIWNDSNGDMQERNFRYIFGERRENTYDTAIYDKFLLNLDFSPAESWNFHTQIVADPWSYVGTTGEQVQISDVDPGISMRYNLKYFGANNSMINETYRNNIGDAYAFPIIKVHDGKTTEQHVTGFYGDFSDPFTIPSVDVDYEFRPIRKMWVEHTEDTWNARVFALADQEQALSTDDPLELSNHRDYWQQSPWLYQYKPIQFFTAPGETQPSFKRGWYDDSLSFLARDSEGNRLVLLRGASLVVDTGDNYFAGTVAAPFTPWDQDYFTPDNIPGALRFKHQMTDRWMMGSTYTFRNGYINHELADFNQVVGIDTKYDIDSDTSFKAEVAGSQRSKDLATNERIDTDSEDYAARGIIEKKMDHPGIEGKGDIHVSFTYMGEEFDPTLSRYTNTRDDHFWGKHLSFHKYDDNLEYFRIGDGIDTNRLAFRARWREKIFKERFENLIDFRNVNKSSNTAFKESVLREELTWHINPSWTAKGMFRGQWLPNTTLGQEPFLSNFYFVGYDLPDPAALNNPEILADKDPSRFTYAFALQWVASQHLTFEGFVETTNDIPDFPRGLLNTTFRSSVDRVDGLLLDHLTDTLYTQTPFGLAPYPWFTITRERVIYKPDEHFIYTFHSTQNGYKYASGIDDNVNHVGLSLEFHYNEKLTLFTDYTFSQSVDVPRMISSHLADMVYTGHHNFYASADYRVNTATTLRAEYGVFGERLSGNDDPNSVRLVTPYSTSEFSLPTLDTEHIFRLSLTGDF